MELFQIEILFPTYLFVQLHLFKSKNWQGDGRMIPKKSFRCDQQKSMLMLLYLWRRHWLWQTIIVAQEKNAKCSLCWITCNKNIAWTLVSWSFEPSEPQRITSGLNANFNLSQGYSLYKSLYHTSFFPQTTVKILSTISEYVLEPIYIPRALNTGTCILQGDLVYSVGLHRNRC